jgi:hypothetical protein
MQTSFSTGGIAPSLEEFQTLQESLAVSAALEREEVRHRFGVALVRFLEVAKNLLDDALFLTQQRASIEAVERHLGYVESVASMLRDLSSRRPLALRAYPQLEPIWSANIAERYESMIKAYGDGAEQLRRYGPAMRKIRDTLVEAKLRVFDSIEDIGTEEERRETWEALRRGLDEDRPSGRKLFPE